MGYGPPMQESPEERRLARKRRRHERARDAVVQAARRILEQSGVEGFTVKAVAAAADISKPAFYYYFESRQHLVAELADRVLAREAAALTEAAYRAPAPAAAAAEVLLAKVRFYSDDLSSFRIVYLWPRVLGVPDGFDAEVVRPRHEQIVGVLADRLARVRAEGAREAAQVTLATADGLLATELDAAHRLTLARRAAALLQAGWTAGG